MRIGEVADRVGVAVKTIRYYEAIGVLAAPSRTPSGYRDYDDSVVERLAFVRAAKSVGLTLGEIRGIVALRDRGEAPCVYVADLLQRRATEISQQIIDLERLERELRRLARRSRTLETADCDPSLVCHLITPAVAIDEANAEIAAMSPVEGPDPPPEFVARAMEHGRKLMADLHELERGGWPPH